MGPSLKQLAVRQAFKYCVDCFEMQPPTGGVEPPDKGPRGRDWWYDHSGDQWYYNYFIQQSMGSFLVGGAPIWCEWIPPALVGGITYFLGPLGENQNEWGITLAAGNGARSYDLDVGNARCVYGFNMSSLTADVIEKLPFMYLYTFVDNSWAGGNTMYFRGSNIYWETYPAHYENVPTTGPILFTAGPETSGWIKINIQTYAHFVKKNFDASWLFIFCHTENEWWYGGPQFFIVTCCNDPFHPAYLKCTVKKDD